MTATTKEQRADLRRLLESGWFKTAYHVGALPALLADAERLADYEEIAGEGFVDTFLSLSTKVAEQAEEIERLKTRMIALDFRAEAAEAERDTLRRLLTETAVPALEYFRRQGWATADAALSTIRAQIGDKK